MKYNVPIYLNGLSLWSLKVVKLLFSFCADAKLKDIAGIVPRYIGPRYNGVAVYTQRWARLGIYIAWLSIIK